MASADGLVRRRPPHRVRGSNADGPRSACAARLRRRSAVRPRDDAVRGVRRQVFAGQPMGGLRVDRNGPGRGLRSAVPRDGAKAASIRRRRHAAPLAARRVGALLSLLRRPPDERPARSAGCESRDRHAPRAVYLEVHLRLRSFARRPAVPGHRGRVRSQPDLRHSQLEAATALIRSAVATAAAPSVAEQPLRRKGPYAIRAYRRLKTADRRRGIDSSAMKTSAATAPSVVRRAALALLGGLLALAGLVPLTVIVIALVRIVASGFDPAWVWALVFASVLAWLTFGAAWRLLLHRERPGRGLFAPWLLEVASAVVAGIGSVRRSVYGYDDPSGPIATGAFDEARRRRSVEARPKTED